jgi:hypothetical protein
MNRPIRQSKIEEQAFPHPPSVKRDFRAANSMAVLFNQGTRNQPMGSDTGTTGGAERLKLLGGSWFFRRRKETNIGLAQYTERDFSGPVRR